MNPKDVFGEVKPSVDFLKYGSGGAGLGQFLSVIITVIYSLAAMVLVFMLIWGAFDWMTSGGEKEKVAGARNKIMHAIIGFVIMAMTFVVLNLLGLFTGFESFFPVPPST